MMNKKNVNNVIDAANKSQSKNDAHTLDLTYLNNYYCYGRLLCHQLI